MAGRGLLTHKRKAKVSLGRKNDRSDFHSAPTLPVKFSNTVLTSFEAGTSAKKAQIVYK